MIRVLLGLTPQSRPVHPLVPNVEKDNTLWKLLHLLLQHAKHAKADIIKQKQVKQLVTSALRGNILWKLEEHQANRPVIIARPELIPQKLLQIKHQHVNRARQVFGKLQLHKLLVPNVQVVSSCIKKKLAKPAASLAEFASLDSPHKVPAHRALNAVQASIRTSHLLPLGVATLAVLVIILLVQKDHAVPVLLDSTSRNEK